MADLRHDDTSL